MSTLEHLFRYAKVSGAGDERLVESQENFTSEALAEAIRRNPRRSFSPSAGRGSSEKTRFITPA